MADPPTPESSPSKKIITDGDLKNNVINALGDLSNVAASLLPCIESLSKYVSEHVTDKKIKVGLNNRIKLIEKTSSYVDDKVKYICAQTGSYNLISLTQSRKRAAYNIEHIISVKTKKTRVSSGVSKDYHYLDNLLKSTSPVKTPTKTASRPVLRKKIESKIPKP